jgi:hypothetical protein
MIDRPRAAALAALGSWLAWGAAAFAQTDVSLNRAGSGARAAGMADAFIAVSDDGTAVSWNPAGLGQLRKPEFSLVFGISDRHLGLAALRSVDERLAFTAHGAGGAHSSIEFASAALPFEVAHKPITLQAGWQRLYRLTGEIGGHTQRVSLVDPSVPPVSIDRDDRLEGGIDVLSVAGAIKVTSRLALGTSVNFWRGDWREHNALTVEPGPDGSTALFSATADNRLRGTNAAAGVLLTYPACNLGLGHNWPFWSSFKSKGTTLSTESPPAPFDSEDSRFRLPRSFGVGFARRLPSRWTLAASVTYDDWTAAVVDRLPGVPGEINFFDGLPTPLTTTRDTVSLNVGAEHLFVRDGSVVPVRFGYAWQPQGAMDPWVQDPVDFHLLATGAGYNTNTFKFDFAVQFLWANFRGTEPLSVESLLGMNPVPDALGRADSHEWRVKMSVIYRLGGAESAPAR